MDKPAVQQDVREISERTEVTPLPWAKFLGPKARRSGTAPHWAGRQVATRCRCGPGAVLRATSHREHPVDPAR